MDDLSMVEGKNQITFSFLYKYNSSIPEGLYRTYLRYGNESHNPYNLSLIQKNGRIWMGVINSKIDTIKVD